MNCRKANHLKPKAGKPCAKRAAFAVLNTLLAVMLVVGLAPSMSFASERNENATPSGFSVVADPGDANTNEPYILDNESPSIENLSIEDGMTYDASKSAVTFTVTDDVGIKSVSVIVDGKQQEVEPDTNGLCTVQIEPRSWTSRTMAITATDYVDYTEEVTVKDFHWTTDFVELNLRLVIIAAIVTFVLVAIALFEVVMLIISRRKPKR